LLLVTKIMTTLSSGAYFGNKEEFMTQFNELIYSNRAQLFKYYDDLTAADTAIDAKPVEIPPALFETSLAVVATKTKSQSDAPASSSVAETQALVS
jgi:hypothetical protein